MTTVEETLKERGARYGTFMENALIGQKLKEVVRANPKWRHLASDQKQMIDVIFDKVSRLITGDPDYTDNYLDIEGYARLVRERIEGLKDVHRRADYSEILGTEGPKE
jgi:hypothetical protein